MLSMVYSLAARLPFLTIAAQNLCKPSALSLLTQKDGRHLEQVDRLLFAGLAAAAEFLIPVMKDSLLTFFPTFV